MTFAEVGHKFDTLGSLKDRKWVPVELKRRVLALAISAMHVGCTQGALGPAGLGLFIGKVSRNLQKAVKQEVVVSFIPVTSSWSK